MKAFHLFLVSCFCVGLTFAQPNVSNISEVEYFFDTDPGLGMGTALSITPNVALLDQNFSIPTVGLPIGTHRLFVRVKNSAGTYSVYEHKTFRVAPATEMNVSDIVSAEYFFNTDPGIGLGNSITITPNVALLDQNFSIPTVGLPIGTHRLFVRVKNSAGTYSVYEHKTFRVATATEMNVSDIVSAEYFFNTDPGIGLGNSITITPNVALLDQNFSIPTVGLPIGTHRLFVRVKNSAGAYSVYEHKTFRVAPVTFDNTASITAAEYFVDLDPGLGMATAITLSGDVIDSNFAVVTASNLADGIHFLFVRVQNADGTWSLYERQEFTVDHVLDVAGQEVLEAIKIYPNPSSDFIHIALPNGHQATFVVLYDVNGKEVFKQKRASENLEIDITSFSKGIYLLILETDSGNISRKIIKN